MLFLSLAPSVVLAQNPWRRPTDAIEIRYADSQPVISYTLRLSATDTTGFEMEMRVRNAPDTFELAMAAHPEYDDRFWRNLSELRVNAGTAPGSATRTDSSRWRILAPGGDATIRWRVSVPDEGAVRAGWRPFISPTGALVGGPHSFLYVIGAELAPASIALELPDGWNVATGLTATTDRTRWFAPTADVLVDSPILVGRFSSWSFIAGDVPHRIAWWPSPDATPFDTVAFVNAIAGVAREAIALFGRAPYRDYTYIVQDGAYGGLEHANSATFGVQSRTLAEGMAEDLADISHEYFHTWNLVRIRPAERVGTITPRQSGQSRGLWFSEGMTILYADLLARRASVPVTDSTRARHLEHVLTRYYSSAGDTSIAPERASFAEYGGSPGTLGDVDPSPHAQGELIGTMLDLMIRESTRDQRTLDDVMRLMMRRFSGDSGFTGRGVERVVAEVCGCSARSFFDRHVRGGNRVDDDRYLRAIGYRARLTRVPARNREGQLAPDMRIYSWQESPQGPLRLLLIDPGGIWVRAGLHTNDQILSVNDVDITSPRALRNAVAPLQIGDTARVTVMRGGRRIAAVVPIAGYTRVEAVLEDLPGITPAQRARRERWAAGR